MENRHAIWVFGACLWMAISLIGCAGYGRLRPYPKPDTHWKIQTLVHKASDYETYYFGSNEANAAGILFDPRNNETRLRPGKMWRKIKGSDRIAAVVESIDIGDFPHYRPSLYRIFGPDGKSYGYLFTGWNHVVLKAAGENALSVYGLKDSPNYEGADPFMYEANGADE